MIRSSRINENLLSKINARNAKSLKSWHVNELILGSLLRMGVNNFKIVRSSCDKMKISSLSLFFLLERRANTPSLIAGINGSIRDTHFSSKLCSDLQTHAKIQ